MSKNILHILPDLDIYKGGLSYASVRLANEQAKLGCSIVVFSISSVKIPSDIGWSAQQIKYIYSGNIFTKYKELFFYLFNNKKIVVHFHGIWYVKYLPIYFFSLILKRPYIISPHGNYEQSALRFSFFKKKIARFIIFDYLIKKSAFLTVSSKKEFHSLKKIFGYKKIFITPIGVDLPKFLTNRNNNITEKEILCISRLNKYKGLLNLIQAWDLVKEPGWKILIAGPDDNGYENILKNEIQIRNLESSISLIGFVDTVKRDLLYRSANFFVLPSLSENFGIVVVEALSYEVPVLTTTETPWTILDINTGCITVQPDIQGLASGLIKMMNLSDNQNNLYGKSGKAYVEENFSWPLIAKSSINYIYENIK